MERVFLFLLPELHFTKSDLNISNSSKRPVIGTLARMITNAIFLSHSLREELTIQIFIEKPESHIFTIQSNTIRYLGPELRSSGSILLKAEDAVKKKIESELFADQEWFQPHRGLLARFQQKPLDNFIAQVKSFHCFIFHKEGTSFPFDLPSSNFFNGLEELLKRHANACEMLFFVFSLGQLSLEKLLAPVLGEKQRITTISLTQNLDFPQAINIINVILDQFEEEKKTL
ncbi:MAG: hypothetical protein ACTSXO_09060 [Candidatus Heimdallarchaeota archaeon]|nr:MAG: hypothetical protein DRO63_06435 [Candidatus Gerdarchaeota archaeon]RLI72403.1 MAG: hypothetical protein DRP02_01975 [Candidatus Gerdarchaeota archaeon]RLI73608.1 MAG: hypothetical protein DRO91_02545 [Candidatus Heimdallarchaeota archaeon]